MKIVYCLLKHVKTTNDRDRLLSESDILLNSLFSPKKNAFEKALSSISVKNAEVIRESFLKKKLGKQDIKDSLNQLKERVQKLNTINLTLSFSPSEDSIKSIFDWTSKNIGEGFILDIKEDPTILGGVVLVFKGQYIDLSLKKRLDEAFAKKRKEITSVLNS